MDCKSTVAHFHGCPDLIEFLHRAYDLLIAYSGFRPDIGCQWYMIFEYDCLEISRNIIGIINNDFDNYIYEDLWLGVVGDVSAEVRFLETSDAKFLVLNLITGFGDVGQRI
ncbi:hypothetical protein V6N12_057924 [Hibiscus sabdariffa]|uniref:Uncharacterized protein n=1 Tax=Hibiscus sabdariffa TaxID=183260 RepID=A0ABR2B466_9ROSI